MSAWGHSRRFEHRVTLSARPREADLSDADQLFGNVPHPDSCTAAENSYSITSSARPSSEIGIVRPSALAVLRLMIRPTFVTCWTGRSAGLSPLRIRPV